MRFYRTGSHTKYDLKVHLVFVPKYRKKVLTGLVGLKLRDMIREICTREDIEIISGKVAPDHVHLFLFHPPTIAVSQIAQSIKGKSSYKILADFSHLRKIFWGRHFWARGYLAVSSGNITDEMIKQYIDDQEGEDLRNASFEVDSQAL